MFFSPLHTDCLASGTVNTSFADTSPQYGSVLPRQTDAKSRQCGLYAWWNGKIGPRKNESKHCHIVVWRSSLRFRNESPAAVSQILGSSNHNPANWVCRIVSTVLGWDNNELKKRAGAIEKSKVAPSKDKLQILKAYCVKPAEEQHMHRNISSTSSRPRFKGSFSEHKHIQLGFRLRLSGLI